MTFSVHALVEFQERLPPRVGNIRLGLIFNDTNALRLLYCTLVRPMLEYGSLIWSPCYNTYIDGLERPQHKFLRLAAYHSGDPMPRYSHNYEYVLNKLNLTNDLNIGEENS